MIDTFKIEGVTVNLRTTMANDIEDYKRWNNPDLKFRDFDAPWLNDDFKGIINHREAWLKAVMTKP